MNDLENERPIFLLGTGRCGSTYWQKILCSADDVWIWGEHEGILSSLSGLVWSLQDKSQLSRWSFSTPRILQPDDVKFGDATRFAWNNGFDREILIKHIRKFISELFHENLPKGKERWGFKEIRYGANSFVPELLLYLFPDSKIVITSRDVQNTVFSTLIAWHRDQVDLYLEKGKGRLKDMSMELIKNWIEFHEFYLRLSNKYPNRFHFAVLGEKDSVEKLLNFVNVSNTSSIKKISEVKVNSNMNINQYKENNILSDMIHSQILCLKSEIEKIQSLISRNAKS